MIARVWHGWTIPQNADAYESLLKTRVLPGIHRVPGYKGAHLLRRSTGPEIEFITITMFDSLESVRGFAGADYEKAVIIPEAHKLLSRFEEKAAHFDVKLQPQ